MKKIFFLAAVILTAVLFASCGNGTIKDDCGCLLDFDEAKRMAKKSDNDILLFITLNGEDQLSMNFITDVMKSSDFAEKIAKKYEVVHIDLSRESYQKCIPAPDASKAEIDKATKYADLIGNGRVYASLLNCQSAPSIYRFTKQGMLVSEIEYDTPITTVEQLAELIDTYDEVRNELAEKIKEVNSGATAEKVAKIDALYIAADDKQKGFFTDFAEMVIGIDKKNESGLVSKYLSIAADLKAVRLCGLQDYSGAAEAYAAITENQYLEKNDKMNAYFSAAYILGMSQDVEKIPQILDYLDKAKLTDPESPGIATIDSMYNYFKSVLENYNASKIDE